MSENLPLKEKIVETLKTCYDPEIPVNVYDLGLIYKLEVDNEGSTYIEMTLTSPNCPAVESLPAEIEEKARSVDGVKEVKLDLVWEPPFTEAMMSDEAKLALGLL